ncbi:hypothetical protein [Actinoplanes sp. NBRC 101535]|uniref:hypothetical protein n=1 Tax=Actinoplanes sp. NBRC 101535 TaxID=3032196 RepID=UPI0024A0B7FC|nr:hypothetical protein [Actinoplanes sp. NBRC 101535]GLY07579.1 hypothetical protein Acsp01_79580 [Actinoplanes sp. NBRC 101535]
MLATPLALLSGFLLFFAWIRTSAYFGYFGIDTQLVGYGSLEYQLRGYSFALGMAVGLVLTCVAGYLALRAGESWTRRHPRARIPLTALFGGLGVLAVAVGFTVAVGGAILRPTPAAVTLIAGAVLAELGMTCWVTDRPGRLPFLPRRIAVGCVILIGYFWMGSLQAQHAGADLARSTAEALRNRPSVTLYSKGDLQLAGADVRVEALSPRAEYRFRYTGLRALVANGKHWILLSEHWTPTDGRTIILKDSDDIRVEVRATGSSATR